MVSKIVRKNNGNNKPAYRRTEKNDSLNGRLGSSSFPPKLCSTCKICLKCSEVSHETKIIYPDGQECEESGKIICFENGQEQDKIS